MVRLKHRYLLVNILYPDAKDSPNAGHFKPANDDLPYTVQFRQPSSDQLDARLLTRLIRDGVVELFGDYGSGMIAGSLQGKTVTRSNSSITLIATVDSYLAKQGNSEIRLPGNKHSHRTRIARPLPARLGRADIHDALTEARRSGLRDASRESVRDDSEGGGGSCEAGAVEHSGGDEGGKGGYCVSDV